MSRPTNPNLEPAYLDKLEREKAYLQKKIEELIRYDSVESFIPDADPYVDIAVSNLQLALNQINKLLYVEG